MKEKGAEKFNDSFSAFMRFEPPESVTKQLFGTEGVNIDGANITENDLFNIPSSLSPELFLDRIKRTLGKDYLQEFSSLWQTACLVYEHERGVHKSLPKGIPQTFQNDKDLLDLLRCVRPFSGRHPNFRGPVYCALLKIVRALYEYQGRELMGLKAETDYFDKIILRSPAMRYDEVQQLYILTCQDNNGHSCVVPVRYYSRAKDMFSCVLKMIRLPEWGGSELLRDPIACTFELQFLSNTTEQEKMRTTRAVAYYLIHQLLGRGVTDLSMENHGLLSSHAFDQLITSFAWHNGRIHNKSQKNPHSDPSYRDLKLNGKIGIPEGGRRGNLEKKRPFEVKITWHEVGDVGRDPYKARQLLSVRTRLFGYVSEKDVQQVVHLLSHCPGEHGLEDPIRQKEINPHLVLVGEQKGQKFYMMNEHFKRLNQAGLIPETIQAFREQIKRQLHPANQ